MLVTDRSNHIPLLSFKRDNRTERIYNFDFLPAAKTNSRRAISLLISSSKRFSGRSDAATRECGTGCSRGGPKLVHADARLLYGRRTCRWSGVSVRGGLHALSLGKAKKRPVFMQLHVITHGVDVSNIPCQKSSTEHATHLRTIRQLPRYPRPNCFISFDRLFNTRSYFPARFIPHTLESQTFNFFQ